MKKLSHILVFAAVSLMALAMPSARAAANLSVTYTYDAPADISAVEEFRAYELTNQGASTLVGKTVGLPAALSIPIANVSPGIHTYYIVAYNSFWGESPRSNTTATPPAALAPGNVKVKVSTTTIGRSGIISTKIQTMTFNEKTGKWK